jgi:hypothetical protein
MNQPSTNPHLVEEGYRRRAILTTLAVIVSAIFFLLAMIVLYAGGSLLLAARASARWPATEGVIIESRMRLNCVLCWPTINYHYEVKGRGFVGSGIAAGPQDYYNQLEAGEKVRAYPLGSKLKVHYDPNNPSVSCLEPGVFRWCAYSYLVFGGCLMSTGFFLIWCLYQRFVSRQPICLRRSSAYWLYCLLATA